MNKTTEDIIQEFANALTDVELFKSLLRVGVQKSSDQSNIIKRDTKLDHIEEYMYISDHCADNAGNDEYAKCKLNPAMKYPCEIEQMWEIAEANTFAETDITSIIDQFRAMGVPMEDISDFVDADTMLYVVTNISKSNGAAAILNTKALHEFGQEHNITKVIAIPSSIHEFLIRPVKDDLSVEEANAMINDVNQEQVAPEEQLGDHAYILDI